MCLWENKRERNSLWLICIKVSSKHNFTSSIVWFVHHLYEGRSFFLILLQTFSYNEKMHIILMLLDFELKNFFDFINHAMLHKISFKRKIRLLTSRVSEWEKVREWVSKIFSYGVGSIWEQLIALSMTCWFCKIHKIDKCL